MSIWTATTPVGFLAVAAGAVLGAWLRWIVGLLLNRADAPLPWGTLLVNLAGGALIGAAIAWFARQPDMAPAWRLFCVTGFLGALTTFSAFSAESLMLVMRGNWGSALAHALAHLLGCLAAAAAGYALVERAWA